MKIRKFVLACTVLGLVSSLYAADTNKKIEGYHKAMKTLEKKTVRALKKCQDEATCVASEYDKFVGKRYKLVSSKLHVRPKHFKRVAKKTLRVESQCIKTTPADANICFENSDKEMTSAVSSLT